MLNCQIEDRATRIDVKVSGELTVAQGQAFRSRILEWGGTDKPFHLDLSEVSHMDLAGLQLIHALWQWCWRQGQEVVIQGPMPQVVAATVALAGFDRPCVELEAGRSWIWNQGAQA